MKCRFFLSLFVLLLASTAFSQEQFQPKNSKSKYQVWEFMTRSTMTMKVIAKRFRVDEKVIKKLSKYRKKKVYPATVLRIPVLVREPVWNPENYNPNQPILPAEDTRTAFEYEWNSDKLDPQLKEDFIILREVKEDSTQLEKLHLHISSLDKSITIASKKLDSIKATEFSFEYDSADVNSVLSKMQRARENYYSMSPVGREIDSLSEIKSHLGDETQRIQNRLNEFEYLNENATYYQATKGGDRAEVDTWTKRVIAETKYEAPSVTPKPVASKVPSKTVTEKTDSAKFDTRIHSTYATSTDTVKKDVRVHASYQTPTDTTDSKPAVRVHSRYAPEVSETDTMNEAQKKEWSQKQQIEQIKTAMKRPIADEDFLGKYELRNRPNITDISISPVKVEMEKDRPKYEIPVDANTARKADAHLTQFKVAVNNNNLNEAVKQLQKAIDMNPHNADAWSYHAELQAATGHSENAIREFTIAQNISRKNARAFYKLGLLYEFSNNFSKAEEYYKKAIQADSAFAKAYIVHAKLSQKAGKNLDAINDYNKLLNLRPAYIVGYKERAQLKSQMKDYAGAIDDYSIYLGVANSD
ncbi:MAG TPA: tetratricopeptide repeat protein, partial [Chitinophagales bacterium]